jgi:hypothetical protein
VSQTISSFKQQKYDAGVTSVAMNLEVDVIPVSTSSDPSSSTNNSWVGGLPRIRPRQRTFASFGNGLTAAAPGSAAAALIVSNIEAAHDELIRRGIDASEMWHGAPFPLEARLPGPDPRRTSYGSFFSFNDPDGNTWLVQEVTTRHPGRI